MTNPPNELPGGLTQAVAWCQDSSAAVCFGPESAEITWACGHDDARARVRAGTLTQAVVKAIGHEDMIVTGRCSLAIGPAYALIEAERDRQRTLGWVESHDDGHDNMEWLALLGAQFGDASRAAWQRDEETWRQAVERFRGVVVQLGAVAVACIDSSWRSWGGGTK